MELQALEYVMAQYPVVGKLLMLLGCFVVLGQVWVAATPDPSDNEKFEKLYGLPIIGGFIKALASFAPIQKKDK
jgi:amino acid permease